MSDQSVFRPSWFDRDTEVAFLNFWPLHRPRRKRTTAWGTVHYYRKGIATGIEISNLAIPLPEAALDSLPHRDPDARDLPTTFAGGPSTYYDRKGSRVFIETEIVESGPIPARHEEPWGAIFRARPDDRIVAVELAHASDLFPGDVLGWLPLPRQTPP